MGINGRFVVDGNVVRIVPAEDISLVENGPKLRKDGQEKKTACHKQSGKKSEVYALQIEDIKKITAYFSNNGKWIYYLAFVLSCNLARRASDILDLCWSNFFNPSSGEFRADMDSIREHKTDKLANPHINSAVRSAIRKYIDMTGCDPSKNGYSEHVFLQLSGNYAGRILSYRAYMNALKGAGEDLGIEYNIGTHSPRKTFGMISRMLHPNDYDGMELLQSVFNHSSTKVTGRYIGLTKQKVDAYYDDMGEFFDDYIVGDKEFKEVASSPVVSLDVNDLRSIIAAAYNAGCQNAGNEDPMGHIEAINEIMRMVDGYQR